MVNTMADIKVTDDSTIKVPARSGLFGVEKKDWDRIKSLVSDFSPKVSFWENLVWFFSATTISLFIAYYSAEDANQYKKTFLICGFCSVLITVLMFIVNYSFSKNTKKEKSRILDEMNKME